MYLHTLNIITLRSLNFHKSYYELTLTKIQKCLTPVSSVFTPMVSCTNNFSKIFRMLPRKLFRYFKIFLEPNFMSTAVVY